MPNDTCDKCRFYVKEPLAQQGTCRAHPPTVFLREGGPTGYAKLSMFPPTSGNNWCGEFEMKVVLAD